MNDLFELIGQSLRLDDALWTSLKNHPADMHFRLALWIVFLAGVSDAIGQSVVLLLNKIKPLRFALSLLISALLYIFGFFFHLISIDFIAGVVFGAEAQGPSAYSLALAYAPLIPGFLVMLPYFGRPIYVFLQVHYFLALIVATTVTYALTPQQAFLTTIFSWLVLVLARASIGRPIVALSRWLRDKTAGTRINRNLGGLEQYLHEEETK